MIIKEKNFILKFIIFLLFTVTSCSSYPDNVQSLADKVFKSIKNNNVDNIWDIYSQNPDVRKFILVKQYRQGRITKKVYQTEMGRILHIRDSEKQKLISDFNRITDISKAVKIKSDMFEIINHNVENSFLTLKISGEKEDLKVNVHYSQISGRFFIVTIYSAT